MADVRALLRQQREARRVTHPHASYSDAGKLLCTLCREIVKSEGLWRNHTKGEGHRARVKELQDSSNLTEPAPAPAAGPALPLAKRKHPDDEAEEETDAEMEGEGGISRKRSKADMGTSQAPASAVAAGIEKYRKDQNLTPPSGHPGRPASVTPAHGIELNIPSRPATPAMNREGSASSTPGTGPSPHIAQSMAILPRRKASDDTTSSTPSITSAPNKSSAAAVATSAEVGGEVDEAEWAAFEADMAVTTATYDESAVVSAPAMTAEQAAAAAAAAAAAKQKAGDGKDGGQRAVSGEKILQDEMEDAARALEDEFEEMEALEEKLQRLKAKREALRRIGEANGMIKGTVEAEETTKHGLVEKEERDGDEDEDEDEDDDDDEDDDGWNGFRFQR